MELNINQNCQLVISGEWDVVEIDPNVEDRIELLVYVEDPSIYKIETNRSNATLVWDLDRDGFYKYFQINLPKDMDITISDLVSRSLIQYLSEPTNSTDFVEKSFFSICKLRNCTVQLEKEVIHNFVNNCRTKSCKKIQDKSTKDILLIAIFVLENLISQERYTEAQMIVDSLSTCGTLCNSQKTQMCNCNG